MQQFCMNIALSPGTSLPSDSRNACYLYSVCIIKKLGGPAWRYVLNCGTDSQATHHIFLAHYSQDIITHKLKITEVVKGIELVNKSTESIKVVLMME